MASTKYEFGEVSDAAWYSDNKARLINQQELRYNNSMTTNTITESSPMSYPYGYGMLDSFVGNIANKFAIEMHNQGIEVPEEAIECIKELCDTASKRARFKAQVEFAEFGS